MLKKGKRRGFAISPGMNRVRVILLFIITPLMTWYAHQRFTNPFKKHVSYELTSLQGTPVLHIYNESSVRKDDLLYIPLQKESPLTTGSPNYSIITYNNDSTFLYCDEKECVPMKRLNTKTVQLRMYQNLLYINGPFFEIVTAFDTTSSKSQREVDLLLAYTCNDSTISSLRKLLRPRLTITEKSNIGVSNIYTWNGKKRLFFKEERYNRLSVIQAGKD